MPWLNLRKRFVSTSIKGLLWVFPPSRKAFETIEHDIFLLKREAMGIRGIVLERFPLYILDRQQRGIVKDFSSFWKNITCCVPQASVLGPLLFLTFINNFPQICKTTETVLLAVDASVVAIGKVNYVIQKDLEIVSKLIDANKLDVNFKKQFN